MIIWLIGISGSGKSTLGSLLCSRISKTENRVRLIDGDIVRAFFNNDLGYSKKEREENIKRIIYGAYLLENENIITIVCNISPFQKLREFCRFKFKNYIEIYLEKDFETAKKNDFKGVYNKSKISCSDIVGSDILFDYPTSCDLKISTDSCSIENSLEKIVEFLSKNTDLKISS